MQEVSERFEDTWCPPPPPPLNCLCALVICCGLFEAYIHDLIYVKVFQSDVDLSQIVYPTKETSGYTPSVMKIRNHSKDHSL